MPSVRSILLGYICILWLFLLSCTTNPLTDSPADESSPPKLSVDTNVLFFGQITVEKTIQITNIGGGRLEWGISLPNRETWLAVTPDQGSNNAVVKVTVDRNQTSSGDHVATINLESNGGSIAIEVHITVSPTGDIIINLLLPE